MTRVKPTSSSRTCPHLWLAALMAVFCLCERAARAQAQEPETPKSSFSVQLAQPSETSQAAPLTITLRDALERARRNDASYNSAVTDARVAHEDRVQARAGLLPSLSFLSQYLGTQGNGTLPSGRYVTNDGVHVYRIWGVFHQDLSTNNLGMNTYHRAVAAEALARAKEEIARRGLAVTVTKAYYGLVVAQRKYATAQGSLEQSKHFLSITQDKEHAGEAAHSDVIKAEIQFDQQKQAFQEAQLAMEGTRLALSVLLFPTLNENFTVVDDLQADQVLPSFPEVQSMAQRGNPDLRAAVEAARQANLDVSAARSAFLPSLTYDVDYGIESNAVAFRSNSIVDPKHPRLGNLGYFATVSLQLPIWNWGANRSKLKQTEYRRQLARLELTQAQRQLLSNLYAFYNEAAAARAEAESLREAATLAAESLRLTALRYQAGEATALELVDAQNTLTQARNAYDDGQARYRVALANLQTLTGSF